MTMMPQSVNQLATGKESKANVSNNDGTSKHISQVRHSRFTAKTGHSSVLSNVATHKDDVKNGLQSQFLN